MSTITFDRNAHTATLRDRSGRTIGTWSNRHSAVQDSLAGEYGTYGIVRFDVAGHVGVASMPGGRARLSIRRSADKAPIMPTWAASGPPKTE